MKLRHQIIGDGKTEPKSTDCAPIRTQLMNPITPMLPSIPPDPMLEHAIRVRAYELYVQRGKIHGHAIDDWLRAEAEIVHGHSASDSNLPDPVT